jgi:hypothetical protein
MLLRTQLVIRPVRVHEPSALAPTRADLLFIEGLPSADITPPRVRPIFLGGLAIFKLYLTKLTLVMYAELQSGTFLLLLD